jgi:hypothetical protein
LCLSLLGKNVKRTEGNGFSEGTSLVEEAGHVYEWRPRGMN